MPLTQQSDLHKFTVVVGAATMARYGMRTGLEGLFNIARLVILVYPVHLSGVNTVLCQLEADPCRPHRCIAISS